MIGNVDNPPNHSGTKVSSIFVNILFPFFTIESIILFNTWTGFLRFFNLEIYSHSLISFQNIFFSSNLFIVMVPIVWGAMLWAIANYVNDHLSPSHTIGLWQTLFHMIFGKELISLRFILVLIGFLFPYLFIEFCKRSNLLWVSSPFFSFGILVIVWIFFYLSYLFAGFDSPNTDFSRITKRTISFHKVFFGYLFPIIFPLSIILGFQIIPESFGRIWGITHVYESLYSEEGNNRLINISPDICWGDEEKIKPISYFLEIENKVVYFQNNTRIEQAPDFIAFFKDYYQGRKPDFNLCVVSLEVIEINGTTGESIGIIEK